jgi:non-ribosomal peptide synthetase component F
LTPQNELLTHSSVQVTPNTLEPLTDSFTNVHDNCIQHLFERQAQHHPGAVAPVFIDQQLTYAQLNRLANRLAWALIEDGIRPDHRIAICVDRDLPMIIGALAVLKAGAAYVPLDTAYPAERLAGILQDAAPRLLLSDSGGRAALGEAALADQPTWDLTAQIGAPSPLESDRENPCPAGLSSHHLAYVIYTSGSTGTPKGVMVEHAQVVRLFDTSHAHFGFHESDTWCLFHSFAFDFSVWELSGALRYGGCLVIAPHAVTRSATDFYRLLCETGVTVLNQTPSAFKGLIDAQAQSALQHQLRYVIFGGEALEPAMLEPWYARHAEHSPQLINMYASPRPPCMSPIIHYALRTARKAVA